MRGSPDGARPEGPWVVVDGYHGFMAAPTDLSAVADRIFYVAGGYKYAMSGEGAAFLHAPPGFCPRPVVTGWYAEFGALAARAKAIHDDNPAKDSMRSWLKSNGINPKTLTSEQANTWLGSLEEAEEVGAPEADDGWKNAAERTRTMKSLMERIAELPAFESEQVNAEMARIGITGEAKPTKAQATELLAAIAEAEELAKATKP